MARHPLFPASDNFRTWALAATRRIEKDYVFLRPKTGTASLSATVSNVVIDINMTSTSIVMVQPMTDQAAGMTTWISSKGQGEFVIASAAAASDSCIFSYVIFPPPQ